MQSQRLEKIEEIRKFSKFDEKHMRMKEGQEEKQKAAEDLVKKYEGKLGFHLRKQKEDMEVKKKL